MAEIILYFFLRCNHHHHLTAFHFREGFVLEPFRQILFRALKVAHRLLVSHFRPRKRKRDFDLIAVSQEAVDVAHFDLIIAFIGTRTGLISLICTCFWFLGFVAFLGLLVFIFTVIHRFATGGLAVGKSLQIHICSSALAKASRTDTTPSCSPDSLIKRASLP